MVVIDDEHLRKVARRVGSIYLTNTMHAIRDDREMIYILRMLVADAQDRPVGHTSEFCPCCDHVRSCKKCGFYA